MMLPRRRNTGVPQAALLLLVLIVCATTAVKGTPIYEALERARRACSPACGVNGNCSGDTCVCQNDFTGDTCDEPPGTGACNFNCGGGQYTERCQSDGGPVCKDCSARCIVGSTFEANGCGDDGFDRHCTVCTECGSAFENYQTRPCYEGSDRVCAACTQCSSNEYQTRQCGADGGTEDRKCETCSTCGASNYYVKTPCGATTDTVCERCDSCAAETYQVANCNGVDNRQCDACTQCTSNQYETRECQQNGYQDRDRTCADCTQCRAGQEYETRACQGDGGEGDQDRRCATCRTCDSDQWESTACSGRNNRQCSGCSVCDSGTQFEASACTSTADAVCQTCRAACQDPYYETGACGAGARPGEGINGVDRVCTLCDECGADEYEVKKCGLFNKNRVCEACRQCTPGLQFATRACNALVQDPTSGEFEHKDRTCRECDSCGSDEYETVPCTPTSNRVCAPCQVRCGDGWYQSNFCGAGSTGGDRSCAQCRRCGPGEIEFLPCGFRADLGRNGQNRACGVPFWLDQASVVAGGHETAGGAAANAFDGNLGTAFLSSFAPSTGNPVRLEMDFGTTVSVAGWHVTFAAGALRDGYIERGSLFSAWDHAVTAASQISGWHTVHDFAVHPWEQELVVNLPERASRWWRFRITDTWSDVPVRIFEVRVWGGAADFAADEAPLKASAPDFQVFWISSAVQPDETVLVVGHDLLHAHYVRVCYTIGSAVCENVRIMDPNPHSLKFTINKSWPTAVYEFDICDRAGRCRQSDINVNDPEVWWFRGNHGSFAQRLGFVRVFGNSLAYKEGLCARAASADASTDASARLVKNNLSFDLVQKASSCYSLIFQVPASVPDGTYEVEIQNGLVGSTVRIGSLDVSGDVADDVFVSDPAASWGITGQLCEGVTCAARSQCHRAGSCRGGVCSHPIKQDGTPCDDGKSATTNDMCLNGECVGSVDSLCAGITCTARDQCHGVGSCTNGVCSDPSLDAGTPCDDADADTIDDACNDDGVCQGRLNPCVDVTCTAKDECHVAGVCASGECSNPLKEELSACGAGGVCKAGVCVAADPCDGVDCGAASDQCHLPGACSVVGGEAVCSDPAKADDEPCDDGDAGTTGERCVDGACLGGAALCDSVTCTAQSQCHTAGTCTDGACSNPTKTDGTGCDDGDDTTASDVCTGGVCAGTNVCTGVECDTDRTCKLEGVCEVQGGAAVCVYEDAPPGTLCDDGDAQTTGDECFEGTCAGVDACATVTCTAVDQCHGAGTCSPADGECSQPLRTGEACDDENAATDVDVCRGTAGICSGFRLFDGAALTHTGKYGDDTRFRFLADVLLLTLTSASSDDCFQTARRNPLARGFVYDPTARSCSVISELATTATGLDVGSYTLDVFHGVPDSFELVGTGGAGTFSGYEHTAEMRENLVRVNSLAECAALCRDSPTCLGFTIELVGGECRLLHTLRVVEAPGFPRLASSFRDTTKVDTGPPAALASFSLTHGGVDGDGQRFDKSDALSREWDADNLSEEECARRALLNPAALGFLFREQDGLADTECALLTALNARTTSWVARSYTRLDPPEVPDNFELRFTGGVGDGQRFDTAAAHVLLQLAGVALSQCASSSNGNDLSVGFVYDFETRTCTSLSRLAVEGASDSEPGASYQKVGAVIVPDGYAATHTVVADATEGTRWLYSSAYLLYAGPSGDTATACADKCDLNPLCAGFLLMATRCRLLSELHTKSSAQESASYTRAVVPVTPDGVLVEHTGEFGDDVRWSTRAEFKVDDQEPLSVAECAALAISQRESGSVRGFCYLPEDDRCITLHTLTALSPTSKTHISYSLLTRDAPDGYETVHTGSEGDGVRYSTAKGVLEFSGRGYSVRQCGEIADKNPRALGFVHDGDRCRTVNALVAGDTVLDAHSYRRLAPPAVPAGFAIETSGRYGKGARFSTSRSVLSNTLDHTIESCADKARDTARAMGFMWYLSGRCRVLGTLRHVSGTTAAVTSYVVAEPADVPAGYHLGYAGGGAGGDGQRWVYSSSRLLYSTGGRTVEECGERCDSSPLCKGFLFTPADGKCRLLRSLRRKSSGNVMRSFVRHELPEVPNKFELVYTGRVGPENLRWDTNNNVLLFDSNASDEPGDKSLTLEDCADKCTDLGGLGFVYHFLTQRCRVVSELSPIQTTSGMASYRAVPNSRRRSSSSSSSSGSSSGSSTAAGAAPGVPAAREPRRSRFYDRGIHTRTVARTRGRRSFPEWKDDVFDAVRYGGVQAALDKARENGGGIVHLSAGVWEMEDGYELVMPPNTILRGKGMGETTLRWPTSPTKTVDNLIRGEYGAYQAYQFTVEATGRFENVFETDYVYRHPASVGVIHGTRIHHVEVKTSKNALNTAPRSTFSVGTDDVHITDNVVTWDGECGGDFPRATVFYVRGATDVYIARNTVRYACWCWNFELTRNVVYEDNWQLAIGTTTSGGQTISNYGGVRNEGIYIANNYMNDEHINPDTLSLISLDARGAAYLGRVTSGSGTSVQLAADTQFSPSHKTDWRGALLTVLRGTGAGQYGIVAAHSGRSWTLETPLAVPLSSTDSVITIGYMRGRYHIVGNFFTKGDQVQMYGASHDVVIAENTFIDSVGTGAWGRYIEGVQPSNYVQFLDNQLYDARRMISQTGYDTRGTAVSFFHGPSCRGHIHRRNHLTHRTHLLLQGALADVVSELNTISDIQDIDAMEVDEFVNSAYVRKNVFEWLAINSYAIADLI